MESIEALENIKALLKTEAFLAYESIQEELKVIAKDLKVLKILREHFSCTEHGQWYIDLQESDFDFKSECTKEEWENSPQKKIKEWLKGK